MAITLDTTLGTKAQSSSTTTVLSTTNPVAAGGTIIVLAGRFFVGSSTMTASVTGLGSMTSDHTVVSGNIRISVFRLLAPSGLSSGTNITVTHTNASDCLMVAASFLGLDTASPLTGINGAGATGTAWTSGTVGGSSGDMYIGGSFEDGSGTATSTETAPGVELYDFQSAAQTEAITAVYKLSGNASDSIAGTWSTSITHIDIGVSYKPATAAGGSSVYLPADVWEDHGPGEFGPNPFVADVTLDMVTAAAPVTTPQALTATATSTATITNQVGKLVTATATSTATIVRQVGKLVTATSTTTATVVKQVGKAVTANATVTATMLALKVILLTLQATVTSTASIIKRVGKALTANTVTTTATIVKQVNKLLQATATSTATLGAIKVILKTITATVTATASIVNRVGKALTATATSTATAVKQVNKPLSATATSTATLQALRVFLRTLTAGTVTTTATMTRRTGKAVTATATVTASVVKRIGKALSAAVTAIGQIVSQVVGPQTQDPYPTRLEYRETTNTATFTETVVAERAEPSLVAFTETADVEFREQNHMRGQT